MNKTAKLVIALIGVAVIVVAAIMIADYQGSDRDKDSSSQTTTSESTSQTSEETTGTGSESEAALTITYSASGFTPSTGTIKAGQSVKVVNSSDQELQFASDEHPTHTDNSELNVGTIEPGASETFTIKESGTWGYHNHLNASHEGSITVE